MTAPLNIALAKGRLLDPSLALFREAGVRRREPWAGSDMARSLTKCYRADTNIQLFVCNNLPTKAGVETTGICLSTRIIRLGIARAAQRNTVPS